jgi:hypothetical protein
VSLGLVGDVRRTTMNDEQVKANLEGMDDLDFDG